MAQSPSRSSRLAGAALLAVVFITGGGVLVVEVVATRILSPYFGNTFYSFSSVIGVVLASLSIGYAIGGRYADRHPEQSAFYGIILFGGLSILLLAGVSRSLLPFWAFQLSPVSGPLISSLILFSLPGFLLGMLSPFVIALMQRMSDTGIGTTAGSVFFWSTLGSIAGSLLTGFIFIPQFGVTRTLVGTAALLIAIGLAGTLRFGGARSRSKAVILVICFAITAGLLSIGKPVSAHVIHEEEGLYQNIRVVDATRDDGMPMRILFQDLNASSGMLMHSKELAFEYSKFFRLAPVLKKDIGSALVLGAGAYSLPKAMLEEYPGARIDVVEIEAVLEPIAKEYFGLEESPRLRTFIEDGRRYLHDTDMRYDVIFGDAYSSHHAMPPHLTTREFFQLVSDRLTDGGVLIVNFIGSLEERTPSLFFSALRTITSVFPNTEVFAMRDPASTEKQNIIILARKSAEPFSVCPYRGPSIGMRNFCDKRVDTASIDLKNYQMLTDDHSPVEYLATFDL